jgi:hypothetical protein
MQSTDTLPTLLVVYLVQLVLKKCRYQHKLIPCDNTKVMQNFKQLIRHLCILLILNIPFRGFSQSDLSFNYSKYSKGNYIIEYPATWRIDTSNVPRAEFSIFSPKENDTDSFSENVNLIVRDLVMQNLSPNITLEEFEQFSEKQIRTFAVDLTGFSANKIMQNNAEYYEVNFEMIYQKYHLHTRQYYFIRDQKSIILTLSCETDKLEKFEPIWNKISSSFNYHPH